MFGTWPDHNTPTDPAAAAEFLKSRQKTLAALSTCARYQAKFKVKYEWASHYPDIKLWWRLKGKRDGTASASFKPSTNPKEDPVIYGKVTGPFLTSKFSDCDCEVTRKDDNEETCYADDVCRQQGLYEGTPEFRINELRFDRGEIAYASFMMLYVGHHRKPTTTYVNQDGKRIVMRGDQSVWGGTHSPWMACFDSAPDFPWSVYVVPFVPSKSANTFLAGKCDPRDSANWTYVSEFEIELK
jgi:hypothetical protein